MNNLLSAGHLADIERRTVASAATGSDHDVYICKPESYRSTDRSYPLLIVLDANYGFATAAETSRMQAATGEAREIIVVGLGTPGGISQHGMRRIRDYTPGSGQVEGTDGENEVGKLVRQRLAHAGLDKDTGLGGAQRFTGFLEDELLPQLFKDLRIDQSDMGLCGHSAGGALACDVLLRASSPFQKLLIGTFPVNWYKIDDLNVLEQNWINSTYRPHVYVTIGGAEFDDSIISKIIAPSLALLYRLKEAAPEWDLTVRTFEDETHSSIFTILMASGIRKLWSSGESYSQAAAARRAREALHDDGVRR